jgi:hypothetical protein
MAAANTVEAAAAAAAAALVGMTMATATVPTRGEMPAGDGVSERKKRASESATPHRRLRRVRGRGATRTSEPIPRSSGKSMRG